MYETTKQWPFACWLSSKKPPSGKVKDAINLKSHQLCSGEDFEKKKEKKKKEKRFWGILCKLHIRFVHLCSLFWKLMTRFRLPILIDVIFSRLNVNHIANS
jgi:hypothetical protein